MSRKRRLTVSVDAELVEAAERAVSSDRVPTVLRLELEHDRRLNALADLVRSYEAEHGEITAAELAKARAALGYRRRTKRE